jgi:hypothetical protein
MRGTYSPSLPRTVSGAHPASYPVIAREMYPWRENNLSVKLTTDIHPVAEAKNAWSHTTTLIYVFIQHRGQENK